MGFGGISIWQLLIVLAIIVLLFGTKKLRGMGGDLGNAVKGFKKAVSDEEQPTKKEQLEESDSAPQQKETAEQTEKNKDNHKA